jgi:HlyD family secretion protein
MDVEFSVDDFPSDRFRGSIKEVRYSPQTVQNVVTYDAVVSVDNRDLKLRPGMTADVTFMVEKREEALLVPNTALRFRPPQAVLDQIGWKPPDTGGAGGAGESGARQRRTARAGGAGESAAGGADGAAARGADTAGGAGDGAPRGGAIGEGAPGAAPAAARDGEAARSAPAGRRERGGGDRASRRLVWKMGPDGLPQPAMVQIGISDGRMTEIVRGLGEGEQIVIGIADAQATPDDQAQGGQGGNRGGGRRNMGRFL